MHRKHREKMDRLLRLCGIKVLNLGYTEDITGPVKSWE